MSDRVDIECVLDAKAGVGESPLWSAAEGCLWWVDIVGQVLHRFAPTSGARAHFSLADQPACVALAGEGLLLALRRGVALFDPATGEFGQHWPADYDCATTRFNDGRCDRQGRFWVGSMFEPRSSPSARLYRLDEQGLTPRIGNLTVANGLAFSPDGRTMYRADSPARVVYRHAYDPESGEVGEGVVFQRFVGDEGRPDGAAVDRDGCYWIAMYDGGALFEIDPDGRRMRRIVMPVRCPTMPCFGGAGLDQLYVTSARADRSELEIAAHPLSGGLFRLDVGAVGLAEAHWQRR